MIKSALVLLFVTSITTIVWRLRCRDVRLPGPAFAAFTKLVRVRLLINGNGPAKYLELHKKYGPVVKTGPNHVSLASPDSITVIYDLKGTFRKSLFYNIFKPLYKGYPMDTIFTTEVLEDKKRSKALLIKYMTSCPQNFQESIEKGMEDFIRVAELTQGQPLDFSTWPWFWAFDTTFAILFGKQVGFMRTQTDIDNLVASFREVVRPAILLGQVPELIPWTLGSDRFMRFARVCFRLPDPTKSLLERIEYEINVSPCKSNNNFLHRLLHHRDERGASLDREEVINILFEGFFAAAAESAVTLRTVVYCLLTYHDCYQKLTTEIRRDELKDRYVLKIPYLIAVIKEALRLYTSNCPPMERIVPSPGIIVAGHEIAPGTIVSVPHFVAHRDPSIWGQDADIFRPERWLDQDSATLKKMEQSFLAFGKGSRGCPGRELGMLEVATFLVKVLRRYDIELASGGRDVSVDMYWIIEHHNLWVRFKKLEQHD